MACFQAVLRRAEPSCMVARWEARTVCGAEGRAQGAGTLSVPSSSHKESEGSVLTSQSFHQEWHGVQLWSSSLQASESSLHGQHQHITRKTQASGVLLRHWAAVAASRQYRGRNASMAQGWHCICPKGVQEMRTASAIESLVLSWGSGNLHRTRQIHALSCSDPREHVKPCLCLCIFF